MPTALNTLTGIVDFQPEHVVAHPEIGRYLKVVPEGTKSLVPGMFKPGTVDEFDELNGDILHESEPEAEPAAVVEEEDTTTTTTEPVAQENQDVTNG